MPFLQNLYNSHINISPLIVNVDNLVSFIEAFVLSLIKLYGKRFFKWLLFTDIVKVDIFLHLCIPSTSLLLLNWSSLTSWASQSNKPNSHRQLNTLKGKQKEPHRLFTKARDGVTARALLKIMWPTSQINIVIQALKD